MQYVISSATGIIPALAGNMLLGSPVLYGLRDHPRACGEHVCADGLGGSDVGSSPRLRGTSCALPVLFCCIGIIPALAGNMIQWHGMTFKTWDHPRACGEHAST